MLQYVGVLQNTEKVPHPSWSTGGTFQKVVDLFQGPQKRVRLRPSMRRGASSAGAGEVEFCN
jgi:hypothetical protein